MSQPAQVPPQAQPLAQQEVPTDSLGRTITGTAAALLAVAAAHQIAQNALIANTLKAVQSIWFGVPFRDFSGGWRTAGPRIYGYISAAQELAADQAPSYIQQAFAVQGISVELPPINPRNFAGATADSFDMERLLVGTVVAAKRKMERGGDMHDAYASGAAYLTTVTRSEITDAGTAADQVALIAVQRTEASPLAKPPASGVIVSDTGAKKRYGWVRMLNPPSCARCAVLAGRFYKWNDGFERHLNCDCRHIPVEEQIAGDLTTDPQKYFNSLSIADQEKYFGVANSAAIAAGGDLNQIVNAALRKGGVYTVGGRRYTREGVTRRGYYGTREAGRARQRRPTPYQIMKDARGDQAAAVRLLKQFGYILG